MLRMVPKWDSPQRILLRVPIAVADAPFSFRVEHVDAGSAARRSTYRTPHGTVDLPAFMPVGTQGSVKGLEIAQLRQTGAEMVLANTYHLALRPGAEVVRDLGGLHRFMGWDGPILTDSGGFQLFSLAAISKVSEEQAVFRSHIDGRLLEMSPERAVAIQEALGSDVAMVLDHVVELPNRPEVVRDATQRSVRWAARCRAAARRPDQALFAIVQGGLDCELRAWCAAELRTAGFRRLRRGRPERRRAARGDVPHPRGHRPRTARRPAAIPDGRRAAGRPARSGAAGHRLVRLRHAHPQRPQCHGLYRRRPAAVAELAI